MILIVLAYNLLQEKNIIINFKKILIYTLITLIIFSITGFLFYKIFKQKTLRANFLGILKFKITLNIKPIKEKIQNFLKIVYGEKILTSITIILGLIILGLIFPKFYPINEEKHSTKEYPLTNANYSNFPISLVPVLNFTKINLSNLEIISHNPDLIFENISWSSLIYKLNEFSLFYLNSTFFNNTFTLRGGVFS
jgi:hypothetical protein